MVALDVAGSMAVNGTITVDGAGFRGGAAFNGAANRAGGAFNNLNYAFDLANINGALKGEGTVGTPYRVFGGVAAPVVYPIATFGQGYALGAAGQAAQGNAAGGGNDGLPATGGNQYNSGGGGGGNIGAGGRGGNSWTQNNAAGGLGGGAIVNSISRLVLGGGGGAGSTNNNATANAVTVWPPTVNATTRPLPTATGVVNGAAGAISVSGASGGGVVLLRAGALSATAGAITARGYTAYNTNGGSEGAGGGGAGGSVSVLANTGTGTGLTIDTSGGGGGYSNYYDHGPGGGGGGGFVLTSTNLTGVSNLVAGGSAGYDGCCGGGQGNASPKLYSAVGGAGGTASALGGSPVGVTAGASCLPVLSVTKSTATPVVVLPAGTTAQYTINVRNAATSGAAYGVNLQDVLPVPFGLPGHRCHGHHDLCGGRHVRPKPYHHQLLRQYAHCHFRRSGQCQQPDRKFVHPISGRLRDGELYIEHQHHHLGNLPKQRQHHFQRPYPYHRWSTQWAQPPSTQRCRLAARTPMAAWWVAPTISAARPPLKMSDSWPPPFYRLPNPTL